MITRLNVLAGAAFLIVQAALFALVITAAVVWPSVPGEPVASITGGKVQGRLWADGTGAFFKGIPFAVPPVGSLRWREPMPVKAWKGVRTADSYAAPCAQINAGWNFAEAKTGSEDCLYLNVWTPAWPPKTRYPVMVWIHGGGNAGGGASGPLFDGEPLARHGVVVVTIQYRLGLFGFLALPELSMESTHHVSGNYAILDQLAALRWVKANIAKFGGDPHQVTVFGQSAGAHDIGVLLTSPLSKGLIARAIEESGTVTIFGAAIPTLADAEQNGKKLTASLQAPDANPMAYLRGISTEQILKAAPSYGTGGLEPNVDGYVIPRSPAKVFASHQELAVPLLIGNNAREFTQPGSPDDLRRAIEKTYGAHASEALKLYGLSGESPNPSYPPYGDASSQFATDTAFRCSTAKIANSHSALAPTYEYEYSHALPGREAQGATHSAELGYLFGTFAMGKPGPLDLKISADVQLYWTNFAKSGDPNCTSLPAWPKHDSVSQAYLEFTDNGPVVKEKLRSEVCRLYDEAIGEQADDSMRAAPAR
jgi:para-nitrobenzyl esterase